MEVIKRDFKWLLRSLIFAVLTPAGRYVRYIAPALLKVLRKRRANDMNRCFMITGAAAGAVAVGLGAFGAHWLKDQVSPEMLDVYETGAQYLLVHAVALVVTGWIGTGLNRHAIRVSGIAFIIGMIFFSGSLLVLSTTGLRFMGAVAPVGGTAYIIGWISLAVAARKKPF